MQHQKFAPANPDVSGFQEGNIDDVVVRRLEIFHDSRGWLAEIFRNDEVQDEFLPAMAYVSQTLPGITRGPHEHVDQADMFCFIGPSMFRLAMWDNRPESPTFRVRMVVVAGEDDPAVVIVPKGIAHAYTNVGSEPGLVINCPNRLYKGPGRREEVDEIRHEDDPETIFKVEE